MKHFVLTLIAATALCSQVSAQSKVKSMSANTLKLDVEQLKNDGQQVRLSRHLFAGYNTLCLPMSMTADQLAEAAKDLKVERLVAIKQTGATLNLSDLLADHADHECREHEINENQHGVEGYPSERR